MPRARRPIRPEDHYRLRTITDPQISPDGAWVACVISQADQQKDRNLSDIWLFSTDGKRQMQLTNRHHRDSSPRWSPDSSKIVFVVPVKDEDKSKPQLWVISLGGGEAKQITRLKQGVSSPAWSPNGQHIAFLARDPKPEDDERDPKAPKLKVERGRVFATDVKITDRIRWRSVDFLPKDERRHIYVVAAAGSRVRKLTDGDCDDSQITWSPDSKQIAFVSTRAHDPDWTLEGDVWVVPLSGGKPRRLSTLVGGAMGPVWSPDGKHIAYTGSTLPEIFRVEEWRLWLQPAKGGKAICLTDSLDRCPRSPRWSADGSCVYFVCHDEGFCSLWRADLNGEVKRVLPKERFIEEYGGYTVAAKEGSIAFLHTDPDHPHEVFVCDALGRSERQITHENRALLNTLRAGSTQQFWCRSFDGTRIQGWVVKPPGFRADRKYPLLLWVHGGPYWAFTEMWELKAQVLAACGYVVVYANPRGSTGYGKDFQVAVCARYGEEDSRDLLAAVDHVIRQGYVDRQRLGVTGASYGGLMTTYLLGTTDRFQAGVALCAATSELAFYYQADMHLWSEQEIGGPPWEHMADYLRLSSVSHAHKIKAPLLLLHAEDDSRVPISCSEMVHVTLKRTGTESVFVRYPSGNHAFAASAPRFMCDSLNRTVDWFDKHLK